MVKSKKINKGLFFIGLLIIGLLVFVSFFLSFQIEQTSFHLNEKKTGIQKSDIKFLDATWSLVDFPGCEYAYDENRAIQEIGLIYSIAYYGGDYNCNLQITTYYDDGEVSTPQSRRLDEAAHTLNGFNVFYSYKFDICCSDGISNACQSKTVKSYC